MPKFIQYSINEIEPYLIELISKIKENAEYTKEEISKLYKEIRNYETSKTKKGFLNILITILFESIKKDKKKLTLNIIGRVLKHNLKNKKLTREILYYYLFNNVDIFRIECEQISSQISKRGVITKTKEDLQYHIYSLVEEILENDEKYSNNLTNAENKTSLTVKNLILAGIANKKDDIISIFDYKPEPILFLILIILEFSKKKISIDLIEKSKTAGMFFISKQSINDILEDLEIENLLLLEKRAGLSQIDLRYEDTKLLGDALYGN